MVRVALQSDGFAVHEAPDGRTALELAARVRPAVVIQDLKLPDIGGIELLECLRRLPGGADVPIIALTGYRPELEHARSATAGFTELLIKPVEPSLLLRVIRTHLPPPELIRERQGLGRRVLVVDDDPVQLKLTRAHLGAAGFAVTGARDGEEALEAARLALDSQEFLTAIRA